MADKSEKKGAFGVPLIAGAVGFGIFAALLAFVYLQSREAALIEKYAGADRQQVKLLVAAQDIRKGQVVRRELLSQRDIPNRFMP